MSDRAIAVIAEDLAARLTQQQARLVYAEDAPLVAKWALAVLKAARIECVELIEPRGPDPDVWANQQGGVTLRHHIDLVSNFTVKRARELAAALLAAADEIGPES